VTAIEDAPAQSEAREASQQSEVTPESRLWSRGDKIKVASIIVTIILAVIGWIVLGA
jgi:hypothetical protein